VIYFADGVRPYRVATPGALAAFGCNWRCTLGPTEGEAFTNRSRRINGRSENLIAGKDPTHLARAQLPHNVRYGAVSAGTCSSPKGSKAVMVPFISCSSWAALGDSPSARASRKIASE